MCACRDDHHTTFEKLILPSYDKCILQLLILKFVTHRQKEMGGKEAQSISKNLTVCWELSRFTGTILILSQLPQYSATMVVIFLK